MTIKNIFHTEMEMYALISAEKNKAWVVELWENSIKFWHTIVYKIDHTQPKTIFTLNY